MLSRGRPHQFVRTCRLTRPRQSDPHTGRSRSHPRRDDAPHLACDAPSLFFVQPLLHTSAAVDSAVAAVLFLRSSSSTCGRPSGRGGGTNRGGSGRGVEGDSGGDTSEDLAEAVAVVVLAATRRVTASAWGGGRRPQPPAAGQRAAMTGTTAEWLGSFFVTANCS